MVTSDGPIYYKDLVTPDTSITDLIKQLEELKGSYSDLMKHIKAEAAALTASMNQVSGATLQGQKATKQAADDAERLAKEQAKLTLAQSDVTAELARLKLAQQEANRLSKIEAKLNTEKEGSYNHLSATYSKLKIEINKLTREERENTEVGQKMVERAREIYAEMNELQQATGKYSLNVGNYSNAIKDAMSSFGESLIQVVQNQKTFGAVMSGVGSQVKAFGATLMGLMTNPAFLIIAGAAGAVAAFKFWYNYNLGIQEATKLTKQFTGASGDELKNLRNEVQATADLYNKDFKEVLIASNAVSKQFGISQAEAIKAIQDGFIAGADVQGEFLNDLKEYPAYFREAGLSASEFIAISTQSAKDGIFSDKGVDTIKEGNLRLREMTKATREALDGIGLSSKQIAKDLESGQTTTFKVIQEVSKKLSELPPQSAAVGTAIADIFGGPGEDAGLRYLTTLKDIELNLDVVKGKSGELGRIQEAQLRAQVELSNTIAAVFDYTGGTFETMKASAQLFVTNGLNKIIKGLIQAANYVVDLYNEAIAFRIAFQSIVGVFDFVKRAAGTLFNFLIDSFKSVGTLVKGIWTWDLDTFKQGLTELKLSVRRGIVGLVGDSIDTVNSAVKRTQKKVNPITIPVTVDDGGGGKTDPLGGSAAPPKKADGKADKAAEDAAKKAEDIRKKMLDLSRRQQDEVLKLEQDAYKKREQAARYSYQRQKEDLEYQLKTDKDLTKEGRESINSIIFSLENQMTQELKAIEQERAAMLLEEQRKGIELRLQAVREDSKEELELRTQLLEIERKIAHQKNESLPESQRQDSGAIDAAFNKQLTDITDQYLKVRLQMFDKEQELKESQFALLRTTEDEKNKFLIRMEIERINEILKLNKEAGGKLSKIDLEILENRQKALEKKLKKGKRYADVWEALGIKMDDEDKALANESTQFAMEQISALVDAKVQAAEKALDSANKEVDASQRRLDAEVEARNSGYANNVITAQKELDLAKRNQAQAEKEKARAVKRQQLLDAISQSSSLITASANIWASLSGIPVVGTALALAALGLMWGSFAASKVKAAQVAGSESYGEGHVEMLDGGSHASGNDIDLGRKKDGTRRRAEGGEFFAVVNKRSSRKYRKVFPDVIKSMNNGTFHKKYIRAFDTQPGGGGLVVINNGNPKLEKDVRAIKRQGEKRVYVTPEGKTVEVYKNRRRIING